MTAEPKDQPLTPSRWRREWLLPLALAIATCSWMLAVEGRQGIGRDESQYFRAGEHYWGWFESLWSQVRAGHPGRAFSGAAVDGVWNDNHEHPPLMKTLFGVSWRLFHTCDCVGAKSSLHPIPITGRHVTLPLFKRDSSAFRFPAILLAGLGVALAYWLARRMLRPVPAAIAAVLSVAQPHYFFHAQISCFDVPITVMAVLVALTYWKSLRSPRWGILCGVFWGVALATKHNAWLFPVFLLAHYLWMRRGDLRRLRLPRVPLAFLSMATMGPLVLFILWPWLWHAPVERTRAWVQRHTQHEHYNFEYLGRNWNLPPKEPRLQALRATFPFVSTLFTLPVTTLALAAVGTVVFLRRRRRPGEHVLLDDAPTALRPSWLRPGVDVDRAPGAFLAIHIAGPMLMVALPSTPIFGGVKHFLPALPFLCVVAGAGAAWLITLACKLVLARRRLLQALPAVLAVILCLPAVAETARSHPDGLGHYNLLAGGFAGGATLGMNRQFWGYSVLPILPWMIQHRPPSNRIYWHDVLHDAIVMYSRDGRLPLGIGDAGVGEQVLEQSDLGIVIIEKHFTVYEGLAWQAYGTTRPSIVYTHEGVPFVVVYERRKAQPTRLEEMEP
ncbi:MAG TPA: glycosyltransferase family 39 protein [Polyangia bacterium]